MKISERWNTICITANQKKKSRKKMKKGILFDLDGTLWDSAQGVVDAWNEVIVTLPTKEKLVTLEDMYSLMGKPMDEIAMAIFPNMDPETRAKVMDECCERENDYLREHGGQLYPNVEETLKALSEKYELFIVSNCQIGYIEAFLAYHKLEQYFTDTENFGRTGLQKGANIKLVVERNQLEKAVYVGDVLGDYNSTMEAGLPFILAEYGFGEVPQANYRIDQFVSLLEVAPKVLGDA